MFPHILRSQFIQFIVKINRRRLRSGLRKLSENCCWVCPRYRSCRRTGAGSSSCVPDLTSVGPSAWKARTPPNTCTSVSSPLTLFARSCYSYRWRAWLGQSHPWLPVWVSRWLPPIWAGRSASPAVSASHGAGRTLPRPSALSSWRCTIFAVSSAWAQCWSRPWCCWPGI